MTEPAVDSRAGDPDDDGTGAWNPPGGRPMRHGAGRRHIEDRRALVETLEIAGATTRQIAERCNVSISTAHADIVAVRKARRRRMGAVDLEAARELELDRLEAQRRWLTPAAQRGNVAANLALLQVAARRSKFQGLDVPQQIVITADPFAALAEAVTDETLRDLTAGLTRSDVGLPEPVIDADSWEADTDDE